MHGVAGPMGGYNVAINGKGLARRDAGTPVLKEANQLERQAVEQSRATEQAVSAALGRC